MLAVSLLYGVSALNIPVLPADALEPMSARSLPLFLAAAGVVLSLVLCAGGLMPEREVLARITAPASRRAVLLLGIAVGYALLLPILGFVVSTALLILGGLLIMGVRGSWTLLLVPFTVTAGFWLALAVGFGMYLDPGLWARL